MANQLIVLPRSSSAIKFNPRSQAGQANAALTTTLAASTLRRSRSRRIGAHHRRRSADRARSASQCRARGRDRRATFGQRAIQPGHFRHDRCACGGSADNGFGLVEQRQRRRIAGQLGQTRPASPLPEQLAAQLCSDALQLRMNEQPGRGSAAPYPRLAEPISWRNPTSAALTGQLHEPVAASGNTPNRLPLPRAVASMPPHPAEQQTHSPSASACTLPEQGATAGLPLALKPPVDDVRCRRRHWWRNRRRTVIAVAMLPDWTNAAGRCRPDEGRHAAWPEWPGTSASERMRMRFTERRKSPARLRYASPARYRPTKAGTRYRPRPPPAAGWASSSTNTLRHEIFRHGGLSFC